MYDVVTLWMVYAVGAAATFLGLWRLASISPGSSLLPSLIWPLTLLFLAFAALVVRLEQIEPRQRRRSVAGYTGSLFFGGEGGDGGHFGGGDCSDGGGGGGDCGGGD